MIPCINTVKYITAIVVVTNIGCSSTTSGSIRRTRAKATAPRRPGNGNKSEYLIVNCKYLYNLYVNASGEQRYTGCVLYSVKPIPSDITIFVVFEILVPIRQVLGGVLRRRFCRHTDVEFLFAD